MTLAKTLCPLCARDRGVVSPESGICQNCGVAFKTSASIQGSQEKLLKESMIAFVRDLKMAEIPVALLDDQQLIWQIFEEAKVGCLKKNLDYGSSAFESPVMMPQLPSTTAILVRMSDKIKRIQSLLQRQNSEALVADESIRDTMRDLGTYAFLWLIADAKKKESNP